MFRASDYASSLKPYDAGYHTISRPSSRQFMRRISYMVKTKKQTRTIVSAVAFLLMTATLFAANFSPSALAANRIATVYATEYISASTINYNGNTIGTGAYVVFEGNHRNNPTID